MLKEGDEVVVHCQICRAPIHPAGRYDGRVCGSECHEELHWRNTLCISQGKLTASSGFASYEGKTPS